MPSTTTRVIVLPLDRVIADPYQQNIGWSRAYLSRAPDLNGEVMLARVSAFVTTVLRRAVLRRAVIVACAASYLLTGFVHLTQHMDTAASAPTHQIVASADPADDPSHASKNASAEYCCTCAAPAMPLVVLLTSLSDLPGRFAFLPEDPLRSVSLEFENPPPIG